MHLRAFSFHAPLFFSFNYLMFLTAGNTTTTTARPSNKSNCVTEIVVPLKFMWIQDCCPISITNCVTAHLVCFLHALSCLGITLRGCRPPSSGW